MILSYLKLAGISFAATVLVGTGAYLKGTWDERATADVEIQQLKQYHETFVSGVHLQYAKKAQEERDRQTKLLEEARGLSEQLTKDHEKALADLSAEMEKVKLEAASDKNAKRPALGVDAIDRINRLRYEPRLAKPGKSPTKRRTS